MPVEGPIVELVNLLMEPFKVFAWYLGHLGQLGYTNLKERGDSFVHCSLGVFAASLVEVHLSDHDQCVEESAIV
jgi:hypothetical protein